MDTEITCLVPGCNKQPDVRGLCNRHYRHAATLVNRKQTTWEKLIEAKNVQNLLQEPEHLQLIGS